MKSQEKPDVKHKMADALEFFMQAKPLSKINVSDIMKKSGLSRQTFYRHFVDIYDLVNWLHLEKNQLAFSIFEEYKDVEKAFDIALRMMLRYKNFYIHIVTLEGPNSFSTFFAEQLSKVYKTHIGEKRLNAEILLSIRLYSVGATKIIVDWIYNRMDMPPNVLAKYLTKSMPHNLIQFFPNTQGTETEHKTPPPLLHRKR
jgi:probable dihydroxyacetone kinase regulator